MPSRQQARIHSFVCLAAEPWIRAFIALCVSARRIQRRCQAWLGSRTRRSASSREHGPVPFVQANRRCFPVIPVPARTVVELEIALLGRGVLAQCGELRHERQLSVVLGCRSRALRLPACRSSPRTCARRHRTPWRNWRPWPTGDRSRSSRRPAGGSRCRDRRGSDRRPPSPCGRSVLDRVVDDEPELLLADVGLRPDLALFRQEHAADERRQLLVVRGHLLQRRVGIAKAQRARAARRRSGAGGSRRGCAR